MAVKNPVITDISGDGSVVQFLWAGANALANGDSGAPVPFSQWADRSVVTSGTPGAAGNLTIEGSNDDGVTYATVNKAAGGTALNVTSGTAAIAGVMEACQFMRPRVTAGDGTTSWTVSVIVRRPNPMRT